MLENQAMEPASKPGSSRVNPWLFVPLLYFMQAVPVTVVQELSTVFYKDLGIANNVITQWTSLIALPWSLQFLLGPLVDVNGRKRDWIFGGQLLITLGLGLTALLLAVPHAFEFTLVLLGATAIVSALCNIATDGFYILALDREQQAAFVGVQSTFYRLGRLFCSGLLVLAVGKLTALPRLTFDVPRGGYVRFQDDKREVVLTTASIGVNNSAGGEVTDDQGRVLLPKVIVPRGTTRLGMDSDGLIRANGAPIGKVQVLETTGSFPSNLQLLEPGKSSESSSATMPVEIGWLAVLLGGALLYGGGYIVARRTTPQPEADVPVIEPVPGDTHRNIERTLAVVLLGLASYFTLNSVVRLLAHGLWMVLGGDPGGKWKGWMLPAHNTIIGFDPGLGGVGTELAQLLVCGALTLATFLYARRSIRGTAMGEAFSSFVGQSGFYAIFGFILFYRFGEAMVSKMSPLFLKDAIDAGGLAVSNTRFGQIKGIAGVIGIVCGGIVGGYFVSKRGLKKAFWPMAVLMHLPNLLYLWASLNRPSPNSPLLLGVDFIDQFGYGFGYAGYSLYLMWVAQRGRFKTAHYAIGTGLGALCIAVAGIVSGIIQANFGYPAFFVSVIVFTVPGMLMLFAIPLEDPAPSN
jgi:hypothetical protein